MTLIGEIWVSRPKRSVKISTSVGGDDVRVVGLPLGLVAVKVCVIDDGWSGLTLMIRKEKRLWLISVSHSREVGVIFSSKAMVRCDNED